MPLDRSKLRGIVGGITTPPPGVAPAVEPPAQPVTPPSPLAEQLPEAISQPVAGQGGDGAEPAKKREAPVAVPPKRFAKTGRPKGQTTGKSTKTKVSLFIDKALVDQLYDWAYQDRIQPGELFERALRGYRDREIKRRNNGTE